MNVAGIRSSVQNIFGDTASVQITPDDIYGWITEAQIDIVRQNPELLQVTATYSSVIGTPGYALPSDINTLFSVSYDTTLIEGVSPSEMQIIKTKWLDTTDSGTPIKYYVWASTLYLYPTPDAVKNIVIHYTKMPTDVTSDASTLSLPVEYHKAIVEYCLARAYELDDDMNGSQQKYGKVREVVTSLKDKESRNPTRAYPSMSSTAEDPNSVWW